MEAETSSPQNILQIIVSDPMKQGEGMNSYVSYKVNTKTDFPHFPRTHSQVIRRYSDFLWLYDVLLSTYPGIIIPPLPEKHVVTSLTKTLRIYPEDEKQKEEDHLFLSIRRKGLEIFLLRIATHSILRENTSFCAFLQHSSSDFDEYKTNNINQKIQNSNYNKLVNTIKGNNITAGIWNLASTINNIASLTLSSSPPTTVSPLGSLAANIHVSTASVLSSSAKMFQKDESAVKFEKICKYIEDIDPLVKDLQKNCHQLLKVEKDYAGVAKKLSKSFAVLSQSEQINLSDFAPETTESKLSNILLQTSNTYDSISSLADSQFRDLVIEFDEPLKDYVRLVQALKVAVETRNNKIHEYDIAMQQLNKNLANINKAGPVVDVGKENLRVKALRDQCQEITKTLIEEADGFKKEQYKILKSIMVKYAQIMIQYHTKVGDNWKAILPQIGASENTKHI